MGARFGRTAALAGAAAVLVLAAGAGGAVAGHKVTSAQIRNNTIKSKDIHNHTIRGKDVHAKAINAGKLTGGVRGGLANPTHVYTLPSGTYDNGTYYAVVSGLPAGTYRFSYQVTIAEAHAPVSCVILFPGTLDNTAGQTSPLVFGHVAAVSASGVRRISAGQQVALFCQPSDSSSLKVIASDESQLIAVRLNRVIRGRAIAD